MTENYGAADALKMINNEFCNCVKETKNCILGL